MVSVSIIAHRPVSHYRPPIRSRDLPLPPRWTPREKAIAERRLTQFVVLSMLVHALAILMFGAPAGGHREGRAMWGSLDVVLKGYREPGPVARHEIPPPAPAAPATVVPEAPAARASPESVPKAPEPVDFPPMLDQLAPSEVKVPPAADFKAPEIQVVPAPRIPDPLLKPLPTLQERAKLPAIEVPVIRVPAETPRISTPMLQPMPPLPQRTTLPPVEAPIIRVPAETPRIPTPLLQPMPAMQERSTLPPVEAPVIRVPVETPQIPAPLMQPITPLPERSSLPPVERLPEPPPAAIPEPPKAPPAIQQAPAAPEATRPTPRIEQAPLDKGPPDASRARPEQNPPPAAARPESPQESPFRRSEPTDYDPTKPSLDLDAMRKRAAEITRQGTGNRALLPFPMPPVDKPKSKLEKAIENARKPDCRDAYKDLGLLAVVPLVANEFGEGTCRW